MTYINKVSKLLLQLGYWVRFGAVSRRSITETCAPADRKSGAMGRTATIARCVMTGVAAGAAMRARGRPLSPRRPRRGNAGPDAGR